MLSDTLYFYRLQVLVLSTTPNLLCNFSVTVQESDLKPVKHNKLNLNSIFPYIKKINEEVKEKKDNPDNKPPRWVVEVSHSWFNRFRKILARFEKLNERYEALLFMAASTIALRKAGCIYE